MSFTFKTSIHTMHVEHRRTVKVVSDNQYKGKSLNNWMKIQDGGKLLVTRSRKKFYPD